MKNLEKSDVTDLEEIMSWAARIVFFGGLAAMILIGSIGLAFWAFGSTPAGMAYY
jgi:hypothetical protein